MDRWQYFKKLVFAIKGVSQLEVCRVGGRLETQVVAAVFSLKSRAGQQAGFDASLEAEFLLRETSFLFALKAFNRLDNHIIKDNLKVSWL